MSNSASTRSISASFGKTSVVVSDGYFMVEPATAVIVSANSHLKTATGGAHDVSRVTGPEYQRACTELLHYHPDGLPQGSAWLTGSAGEGFALTAGKRRVIQAITLRYFNNQRIRATPEIVYHAARVPRSQSPTMRVSTASPPISGRFATATARHGRRNGRCVAHGSR